MLRETGAQIVGGVRWLQFLGEPPSNLGPLTREVLGEKYYGPRMCRSDRRTLACTGNVLVRRKLFDKIGRFDTDMYRGMSDIDLTRRAFDAGVESWYSPRAVVRHLIPAHRLEEDYLRWTCLRVGMNLFLINRKSWGLGRALIPCLLRAGHALTLNPLLTLAASLGGPGDRPGPEVLPLDGRGLGPHCAAYGAAADLPTEGIRERSGLP